MQESSLKPGEVDPPEAQRYATQETARAAPPITRLDTSMRLGTEVRGRSFTMSASSRMAQMAAWDARSSSGRG